MQKEVLHSHKLQDHTYELLNPLELKEDKPSRINCYSQLSLPTMS